MMRKEENVRLEEEESKICLRNQPKYVQRKQQTLGVENARRQPCQIIAGEKSERKQQEIKIEQVFRAGSILWLIAHHHRH